MTDQSSRRVLITGASAGIGATYADRFARRGHDLVLVARNGERMEALARQLRGETGAGIELIVADLTERTALARVEDRLRSDESIGILVNNAGAAMPGALAGADLDNVDEMIRLNVTAPTRLTGAALPRLLAQGGGSIINIASVLGLAPEASPGVYSATKSYLLTFSQALHLGYGARGIYVQAVLPAMTRTEIWDKVGINIDNAPGVMEVGELVDAALAGFDRRELVTIPPLHDAGLWDRFDAARLAMIKNFGEAHAAPRYKA